MRSLHRIGVFVIFFALISGCEGQNNLAPVREVNWPAYSKNQNTYRVVRGDTLYAIAFKYDTDFRKLAALNRLNPPYYVRVGQILRVHGGAVSVRPTRAPVAAGTVRPAVRPVAKILSTPRNLFYGSHGWYWPVRGTIVATFVPAQGKKGINIACKKGEIIRASSAGVVAYSGNGLSGYGNLIIIKHNNEFLTAYGNNTKNLVSEGQQVKAGQAIAQAGTIEHRYWGVHFEIRKRGVPVNPLYYLPRG